ncbi:MAG TPA: GNAT family N-acetyltransferase [Solirubrobacteraceae bacterium]|nr:GNAT family N-acetyltransferase [Solirubrobacteraceae bacterium]
MSFDRLRAELAGSVVRLEPLAAGHEDGLFEASRDPAIWTWLALPGPPSRVDLAGWLERSVAESAAGRECAFATISRATGRVIGSTRFMALRPEHRGLEIGWTWLDPAWWRTGANVEAKLLMLEHAFAVAGCIRVEFKTDARNERSRAALAALPAAFEGIFRNHMVMPYGRRDSAYYSVIADDWEEVRVNLLGRLRAPRPASAPGRRGPPG